MFVCLFILFRNAHAKLESLFFRTQLKTLFNVFHNCPIYLFGFCETRADRVTLVLLGEIGFDILMVVGEAMGFGELAVSGVTFQ